MNGVIVHEWIERFGGAEQVLDAMASAYPDADLWCAWNDAPERHAGRRVFESPIARTPLRARKALALGAMPLAWRRLRAPEPYDWMLVSSHAFAHHARFVGAREIPKLVYAHTPARYLWSAELDRRGAGVPQRIAAVPLRVLDRRRAQEPVAIAANSAFIRERIRRAWLRDATVIHPPVDVDGIAASHDGELSAAEHARLAALPSDFVLGASRFVDYKRLDLVIRSAAAADVPAVLAGSGSALEALRALAAAAGVRVDVIERPSTSMLRALYRRARVLVFPAVEDFGIVPVEALASGTPVIVTDIGGTTESVTDGVGGVHVHDWEDRSSLADAVAVAASLDRDRVRASAARFGTDRFVAALTAWVADR